MLQQVLLVHLPSPSHLCGGGHRVSMAEEASFSPALL